MIGQSLPTELVALARTTADRIAADAGTGSLAYLQLVVSGLYEGLQAELGNTPSTDADRRGRLAAAVDQCRRSADASLSASRRLAELRATLSLLEPRRRFTVIEGGLSKR